jgi:hypothetical protein
LDLTSEFNEFYKFGVVKVLTELSADQLRTLDKTIRKINLVRDAKETKTANVSISVNEIDKAIFIKLLNRYNENKDYLRKNNAIKNSIVSRIKQISKSPSTQILANIPIDTKI